MFDLDAIFGKTLSSTFLWLVKIIFQQVLQQTVLQYSSKEIKKWILLWVGKEIQNGTPVMLIIIIYNMFDSLSVAKEHIL